VKAINALFDPPATCIRLNLTHFVDCYATAHWRGSDRADYVWIGPRDLVLEGDPPPKFVVAGLALAFFGFGLVKVFCEPCF
jgi:hypothetical protein